VEKVAHTHAHTHTYCPAQKYGGGGEGQSTRPLPQETPRSGPWVVNNLNFKVNFWKGGGGVFLGGVGVVVMGGFVIGP